MPYFSEVLSHFKNSYPLNNWFSLPLSENIRSEDLILTSAGFWMATISCQRNQLHDLGGH